MCSIRYLTYYTSTNSQFNGGGGRVSNIQRIIPHHRRDLPTCCCGLDVVQVVFEKLWALLLGEFLWGRALKFMRTTTPIKLRDFYVYEERSLVWVVLFEVNYEKVTLLWQRLVHNLCEISGYLSPTTSHSLSQKLTSLSRCIITHSSSTTLSKYNISCGLHISCLSSTLSSIQVIQEDTSRYVHQYIATSYLHIHSWLCTIY